ncbi:DUF6356 family protein [Rhizorhabdus sp. FW153]|uniref:DUF6356 family protein n=1 Tax=Rhizorhabdus sp. FW153 TaxID=3400216 RepID=UPI003CEAE9CE
MKKLFLDHPASVGESYAEHFVNAAGFGLLLGRAACACFIHALVPALFERTASRLVTQLHDRMVTNRRRRELETSEPGSATARQSKIHIGATQ